MTQKEGNPKHLSEEEKDSGKCIQELLAKVQSAEENVWLHSDQQNGSHRWNKLLENEPLANSEPSSNVLHITKNTARKPYVRPQFLKCDGGTPLADSTSKVNLA